MARYTGPKSRIARKFGEGIFGADKVLSKKNYPPGQHGNSRKRKTSEYGVQLREKQKAKYTYGVLEKQFRNLFEKAETAKGITGEILLQLLEGRLDNIVFRLGIALPQLCHRTGHRHRQYLQQERQPPAEQELRLVFSGTFGSNQPGTQTKIISP